MADGLTVAQFAERWLLSQIRLKPTSYYQYAFKLRVRILPALGTLPVARLEPAAVVAFGRSLVQAGLGPASVRSTLLVLHALLETACRRHLVRHNAAAGAWQVLRGVVRRTRRRRS